MVNFNKQWLTLILNWVITIELFVCLQRIKMKDPNVAIGAIFPSSGRLGLTLIWHIEKYVDSVKF